MEDLNSSGRVDAGGRPGGCGAETGALQRRVETGCPVGRWRPASSTDGDGFNILAEASGYWTTTLAVCGCTTETVRIVVAGS